MDCEELADRIDEFVDGELSPGDAAAFDRHVADCAACRQVLERASRLRHLLADYGESVVPLPDAEFFAAALARAAEEGARQKRNRWLMTALGAVVAAALAALIVGGVLTQAP